MKKGTISNFLRALGLIYLTDWIRFYVQKFRNRKTNKAFRSKHPDVKLPPDYLMYESFQVNYNKYYTESIGTARWLASHFSKHKALKDLNILDWGCGPGRIIRHLPDIINEGCEFYGTDYNAESIKWCTENLPGISFNKNTLEADLPYPDNFFDIIYGISIFTHLSKQMHYEWYKELYRILKPAGIMFLTTQGANFKTKLTGQEIAQFEAGNLVVRGKVKEGHRTYSAFQPKAFIKQLFAPAQVLEHIEQQPENGKWLPQDIWIIRK